MPILSPTARGVCHVAGAHLLCLIRNTCVLLIRRGAAWQTGKALAIQAEGAVPHRTRVRVLHPFQKS